MGRIWVCRTDGGDKAFKQLVGGLHNPGDTPNLDAIVVNFLEGLMPTLACVDNHLVRASQATRNLVCEDDQRVCLLPRRNQFVPWVHNHSNLHLTS
jgi:hypothetical protein